MSYATGRILAVVFTLAALTAVICVGQDVPKGVNYKKATAEINAKANRAAPASVAMLCEFLPVLRSRI
jgi:hypothetical protein